MKAVKSATLKGIYERAKAFDVLAVDEGQFFPDLVEYAEKLAN
jgi:thymidine kinase